MKTNKWKTRLLCGMLTLSAVIGSARAVDIQSSEIGVGIKNLLNDISIFLVVLSPIAGGAAAVYFLIRRSMADEQDGKMWTHRIVVAILCGVGGMLVSGIITLVSSYF